MWIICLTNCLSTRCLGLFSIFLPLDLKLIVDNFLNKFLHRYQRYERALIKGHKQSLDSHDSKENLSIDMDRHKHKAQIIKMMQDGNELT